MPDLNWTSLNFAAINIACMHRLTHLIQRSVGECPGFAMYVLSQDDQVRIARVLSRFESA